MTEPTTGSCTPQSSPPSPSFGYLVFPTPSTISLMNDSSYEADRPHKCLEPGCFQQFKRKFTLTENMKTHTNERPFVCPVKSCARTFATSGNLSRHKRLHPWLQPPKCLVAGCGRSFVNEAKLERHLATHFKISRTRLEIGNQTKRRSLGRKVVVAQEHTFAVNEGDCHAHDSMEDNTVALLPERGSGRSTPFEPLAASESCVSDADLLEFLESVFDE